MNARNQKCLKTIVFYSKNEPQQKQDGAKLGQIRAKMSQDGSNLSHLGSIVGYVGSILEHVEDNNSTTRVLLLLLLLLIYLSTYLPNACPLKCLCE